MTFTESMYAGHLWDNYFEVKEFMEFTEGKFRMMTHSKSGDIEEAFETKSRNKIKTKEVIKDLRVWAGKDVSFEVHIECIVQPNKIKTGMLYRVFTSRQESQNRTHDKKKDDINKLKRKENTKELHK